MLLVSQLCVLDGRHFEAGGVVVLHLDGDLEELGNVEGDGHDHNWENVHPEIYVKILRNGFQS